MSYELMKSYNKSKHIESIKIKNFKFEYLFSKNWKKEEDIPYVLRTHLLDSYYCLPERPDMAFTFLWKCINNAYSTYQRKSSKVVQIGDSVLLQNMSDTIASRVSDKIITTKTVGMLIEKYIDKIPNKILHFISNYILKSYVIKQKITDERYVYSSYNTFKSKFPNIHDSIISAYGQEYLGICNPIISNGEVDLRINDKDKSLKIIHSLSEKLKELIKTRQTFLSHNNQTYTLKLNSEEEYIQFILFNILYAIRNNTVHGKIASRLNSDYVNPNSFQSSKYIYLLGYMFLSLMLYISDDIKLDDLEFNFKNIKCL
ncbi:hypothetical protein FE243_07970 [Aliarcobacter thereius]|uniref:hypothetical protein n=1 Tax=Aliarcobacter thereius TaxID=544718 RepID=UPI0010FD6198|nr:hypothetical protein [Aliarcobacter thereius]TLT06514.1 hypothetical protein FE243_07970 [Aliarcobacter thereius]